LNDQPPQRTAVFVQRFRLRKKGRGRQPRRKAERKRKNAKGLRSLFREAGSKEVPRTPDGPQPLIVKVAYNQEEK